MSSVDTTIGAKPQGSSVPYRGSAVASVTDLQGAIDALRANPLANGSVTYAKLQNESATTLLGNPTGAPAAPSEITLGAALTFVGSALQTVAHTGDVTSPANSHAMTIAANAVTNAKFRQGAGLSVVGVAGSVAANVADIVGAASTVLAVNASATALAFTLVTGAMIANNAVGNAQLRQGAGLSLIGVTGSVTANVADIVGNASSIPNINAAASSLTFTSTPVIGTSVTVPVAIGGTGVASVLELRATSGVGGGSEAVNLTVGNNGATNVASFTSSLFTLQNTARSIIKTTGGTTQPLWDFIDDNNWVGSGGAMRFFSRDSNNVLQEAGVINGGLAVKTAGAFKGDFDFIVYGPSVAVQAGFSLSGIYTGVVPINDNAYALGASALRWSDLRTVTATISGVLTPVGGVAAAGGFSTSPRLFHSGGKPAASSTDGTDTTVVTTVTAIAEVFIDSNATITGVSFLNGSAVANGSAAVALANSSGVVVASSSSAVTSGANSYQRIAFTSTYAAVGPATYYILLQHNNALDKYRTHAFGDFGASQKTGETFGTFTTITTPTTFTAGQGPIASLY